MSTTRKLTAGLYEITGTADDQGQPLRADHVDWRPFIPAGLATRPYWAVTDSHGRELSRHATMREAVEAAYGTADR